MTVKQGGAVRLCQVGFFKQAVFSCRILMLLSLSVLQVACGNSGGNSAASVNHAPSVNIGPDFTIGLATAGVPLTAVISDPDGNALTIQWTFTGFAASALTPAGAVAGTGAFNTTTATSVIVQLTTIGLYTFTATVSDGIASASDQIVIDFTNELAGVLPASLKDVQAPVNPDIFTAVVPTTVNLGLRTYIKNNAAAIKLGKALFWDEQVGSDAKQACASCHFHAGVDNRIKNTLNAGPANGFDLFPAGNANSTLTSASFPLHQFNNPEDRFSGVLKTTDDIIGSEGVFDRLFDGLTPGSALEPSIANPIFPDAKGFTVAGVNVRRVTGRNAPTAINAVFNLRNFHDGRARHHFNGVNPFGNLDTVVTNIASTPILTVAPLSKGGSGLTSKHVVAGLDRSSLASQAVGPPLSDFEMSHGVRTTPPPGKNKRFPDLGKKLLHAGITVLGQQQVDATDSVLGAVSNATANGIADTYKALIQTAFQPEFWDSTHVFTLNAAGLPVEGAARPPASNTEYTMMEINFSLFFGLAVQAYEATLIADDSRFDQFVGAVNPYNRATGVKTGVAVPGNPAALTAQEKAGMNIFFGKGLCFNCHAGPELTLAGVNALGLVGVPGEVPEFPVEKMIGGAGGQQATLEFATAGVTAAPGVIPLNFDPRGKRLEITRTTPPVALVYSDIFPGVASTACLPQQLAIALTPAAIPPIGGIASAVYAELAGVAGCAGRTFSVALAQSITIPPSFPPIANYSVNLFDPVTNVLVASRPINITLAPILYDLGFYNIGIRPTTEDLGVGGTAPSGLPLSLVRQTKATGISEFTLNPGINLATDQVSNVDGAFKVPGLRNVELTGPYFHNGGKSTLLQSVNHYDRGADFHETNIADLAPDMVELFFTATEKAQLVAFLKSLTDERVRNESAPFDHPQLHVPHGAVGNDISLSTNPATNIIDILPAVGSVGHVLTPLKAFDDPAGGSVLTP